MSTPWTKRLLAQGKSSIQAAQARMETLTRAFRTDGWSNSTTGINTSRDKTTAMLPYTEVLLDPLTLETLYHTSDLATKIVSAVPDECFREPWSIINRAPTQESSAAEEIQAHASDLDAECNRLGVRQKYREAQTWGRLYGLGAVLVGVNDGLPAWEPVDWARVRSIDYLTVLDKRDLIPWRWYADPQQPKFGDVALYQVQPVGVFVGAPYDLSSTNQIILVHESRLIRFGGEITSKRERLRNQGADYSVLQKCYRAIQLVENNWQSASALMADASQGVFKIKGLMDMITQEPGIMQTRMQLVDQMRSVVRALILDTEEEFERVPTPLGGISDLLVETWTRLAAAARIPLTVLMGTSPKGLNATGESDLRWWYDTIRATQREDILPNVEYLLRLMATANGYGDAQNWSVEFAPLWQMTADERAKMEYTVAQKDQIYMQEGVLTPNEVALSRYGTGYWKAETHIDVDSRKEMMALEIENQLEQLKNPPLPLDTPGAYGAGAPSKEKAVESTPDPGPPSVVET